MISRLEFLRSFSSGGIYQNGKILFFFQFSKGILLIISIQCLIYPWLLYNLFALSFDLEMPCLKNVIASLFQTLRRKKNIPFPLSLTTLYILVHFFYIQGNIVRHIYVDDNICCHIFIEDNKGHHICIEGNIGRYIYIEANISRHIYIETNVAHHIEICRYICIEDSICRHIYIEDNTVATFN